jgi:hypothetical protein
MASRAAVNFASRSRISKRKVLTRSPRAHQEVAGGLDGPVRGRMSSHPEQMDPSGAHFHDEQDVKAAQPDGVEGKEIGGQQPGGLSAQEGPPPCRARKRDAAR